MDSQSPLSNYQCQTTENHEQIAGGYGSGSFSGNSPNIQQTPEKQYLQRKKFRTSNKRGSVAKGKLSTTSKDFKENNHFVPQYTVCDQLNSNESKPGMFVGAYNETETSPQLRYEGHYSILNEDVNQACRCNNSNCNNNSWQGYGTPLARNTPMNMSPQKMVLAQCVKGVVVNPRTNANTYLVYQPRPLLSPSHDWEDRKFDSLAFAGSDSTSTPSPPPQLAVRSSFTAVRPNVCQNANVTSDSFNGNEQVGDDTQVYYEQIAQPAQHYHQNFAQQVHQSSNNRQDYDTFSNLRSCEFSNNMSSQQHEGGNNNISETPNVLNIAPSNLSGNVPANIKQNQIFQLPFQTHNNLLLSPPYNQSPVKDNQNNQYTPDHTTVLNIANQQGMHNNNPQKLSFPTVQTVQLYNNGQLPPPSSNYYSGNVFDTYQSSAKAYSSNNSDVAYLNSQDQLHSTVLNPGQINNRNRLDTSRCNEECDRLNDRQIGMYSSPNSLVTTGMTDNTQQHVSNEINDKGLMSKNRENQYYIGNMSGEIEHNRNDAQRNDVDRGDYRLYETNNYVSHENNNSNPNNNASCSSCVYAEDRLKNTQGEGATVSSPSRYYNPYQTKGMTAGAPLYLPFTQLQGFQQQRNSELGYGYNTPTENMYHREQTLNNQMNTSSKTTTANQSGSRLESAAVKLFVNRLPKKLSNEELRAFFSPFGNVLECNILKDSKGPKGCAFVKYERIADAHTAILNLHSKQVLEDGFGPIQIKFADGEIHRLGLSPDVQPGGESIKVFVGCLPKTCSESNLFDLFSAYGRVDEVHLLKDQNNQPKCSAFVTFPKLAMAESAINSLDKKFIMRNGRRPIEVRLAESKYSKQKGVVHQKPQNEKPNIISSGTSPENQTPSFPQMSSNVSFPAVWHPAMDIPTFQNEGLYFISPQPFQSNVHILGTNQQIPKGT